MSRRWSLWVALALLLLWVVCGYGVRYGLMESTAWVAACVDDPSRWQCQVRSQLGMMVYLGVFGWAALAAAVLGFFLRGRAGRWLAALGLVIGLPALVLYSASLAVFAVVIAGLRLVRR
jgi:hypothetical protein